MTAIVKLQGVCKDYGRGELTVHALRDVSLELQPGEFVSVAGPSGSGKTTLLNIVSGLDKPSAGRAWVDGQEVTAMGAAALSRLRLRRIGFVFQAYNLMPVLTAFENAEYVLMMQNVDANERRERVMAVLDRVGLRAMVDRFPNEMSGGQQQRVAIARAIASRPALVLADEPTANLDTKTSQDLLDLMAELNRDEGISFVFSSHDPAVIERARRLIILRDGAIDEDRVQG